MVFSDTEAEDVIALLVHDLVSSLAWGREEADGRIRAHALRLLEFVDDPRWFRLKLVEDVQQEIHDTFVDPSWPACPLHGSHPLWPREEPVGLVWRCDASGRTVAAVGSLSP